MIDSFTKTHGETKKHILNSFPIKLHLLEFDTLNSMYDLGEKRQRVQLMKLSLYSIVNVTIPWIGKFKRFHTSMHFPSESFRFPKEQITR